MPLNYSKWDQLELSDDSDIEGHPNVDKRSLIRWKQRDIHEKREVRKQKIMYLQAQISCNHVLLPRIREIADKLADPSADLKPTVYLTGLVERLEKQPSRDCPSGNDPSKLEQTYDGMLLSLLRSVSDEAKEKARQDNVPEAEKDEKIGADLAERMKTHVKQLGEMIDKDKVELESEIAEQKKRITSDDVHEGFQNKYVPPKPAPAPLTKEKSKDKKKTKATTEFEVINPKGVAATEAVAAATNSSATPPPESEEEEEEIPELTPSLEAFSKLPLKEYQKSFEFIQHHRDVYVPGASDALLVAAFRAQQDGKKKYAKQCVHQSLLLQYCEKLGVDGVGVFFKKMMAGEPRAKKVFEDDVEATYKHLEERVRINLEEQEAGQGKEQIQLIAEGGDQSISFNVPDGPPPEDLRLEGPGTEDLDIEEVRKALQFRWDVFSAFPEDLQEALKSGSLEEVNKVLADMEVQVAENVVQQLDMAGILNFAEEGIRDETGNA
ncbi:hypothetical protein M378DRAFT_80002 [Amanita muscaria Koide BX008]|uniref:Hsp90 chaperone protein kinase-targeting subunit n=1 Tax=Amanita muscaria (strain Koide BX008) TaxID=946122 RepID=A0A0C2WNS6_AMAMK|nr:hypothetical protein M378DRAFT_80002 [Amanita muscaria Koide BX008]